MNLVPPYRAWRRKALFLELDSGQERLEKRFLIGPPDGKNVDAAFDEDERLGVGAGVIDGDTARVAVNRDRLRVDQGVALHRVHLGTFVVGGDPLILRRIGRHVAGKRRDQDRVSRAMEPVRGRVATLSRSASNSQSLAPPEAVQVGGRPIV